MIKGVIFDRDGTLIEYVPYLSSINDVVLYPGVLDACHQLKDAGIQLFIVTNQSGIGRDFFSDDQYHVVATYIERLFDSNGISIKKTYYCPYHPEHGIGEYKKDSNDRKPNPGMIQKIMEEFQLAPNELIMIGDSSVDIGAAQNAGVLSARVRTGLGDALGNDVTPDFIGDDVLDVVTHFVLTQ